MKTKTLQYAKQDISLVHKIIAMPKRIYFETTETVTKQAKGWIEVEEDFTQVYHCFSKLAAKMKSIVTIKLLFWLLSHEANKKNGISSNSVVWERFNKFLKEEDVETIALRTFQNSFDELMKRGAITRVGKGLYYLNPYVFWKDHKKDRLEFITDEAKEKKYTSKNVLDVKDKPIAIPLKKKK